MKFRKNLSRCVLAGAFMVSIAMLATQGLAQDRRGGGQKGLQTRGQSQTRSSQTRQRQTNTATRRTQTRTRTNVGTQQRTRVTQTRTTQGRQRQINDNRRTSTQRYANQITTNRRALRYQNGPTGRGISATSWRNQNPNWNGGYYYHNGGYFYDTSYSSPAIVINEWSGIAALAGGIALIGALNQDTRLVFSAEIGDPYSYSQFQLDLDSSDPEIRLRVAYFRKPYFWRNGVRYDRITVTFGGAPAYQFRRHSGY